MEMDKSEANGSDWIWWLLGALCFIAGIILLLNDETIIAIEQIVMGLVFIELRDEDLRKKVFDFFLSIFRGLWNILKKEQRKRVRFKR